MVRLVYAWAATVAAALQRAPRPRLGSRRSAAAASDDADWFAPRHRAACPSVDEDAWPRLEAAARVLYDWNAKINVVSRKGLDPLTLIERHYLPSLALLAAPPPVWKSKFYDAFVLNHIVVLHAIDATPARWHGDADSSPLDGTSAATPSLRNDLVKNCRVHLTHWLISTQV